MGQTRAMNIKKQLAQPKTWALRGDGKGLGKDPRSAWQVSGRNPRPFPDAADPDGFVPSRITWALGRCQRTGLQARQTHSDQAEEHQVGLEEEFHRLFLKKAVHVVSWP